jgi:hypothetical protein
MAGKPGNIDRITFNYSRSHHVDLTGLTFPSNTGTDANTVRFDLSGANAPAMAPLTIIWRVFPVQQTGYYTTFFVGEINSDFINTVKPHGYVGCHPYPDNFALGTNHNWEISIEGNDYITDDNANNTTVVKNQWYQQAMVQTAVGNNQHVVYYWDLVTSSNRVMTYQTTTNPLANAQTNPGVMWADNPWNPADECLSGTLRGIQIFQAALTLSEINSLRTAETDATALSTASGLGLTHWYLNINPTPTDVTDKSGNGRNPSWTNANRPTLYSA